MSLCSRIYHQRGEPIWHRVYSLSSTNKKKWQFCDRVDGFADIPRSCPGCRVEGINRAACEDSRNWAGMNRRADAAIVGVTEIGRWRKASSWGVWPEWRLVDDYDSYVQYQKCDEAPEGHWRGYERSRHLVVKLAPCHPPTRTLFHARARILFLAHGPPG